ncbi:MAG: peptide chain release factor N(5)-glutamine methyltransferase [Gemmatimonadaceae bacterium]
MILIRTILEVSSGILQVSTEYNELETVDKERACDREAREMLSAILDVTPGEVSRRSDKLVDESTAQRAYEAARRRSLGEPLAYCLGSAAFRHLILNVDSRVLIPRPETEVVVDEALKVTASQSGGIAIDIGTGSGAIAISLATEGKFDRVIATDLSPDALAVASGNANRIMGQSSIVEFRKGGDFEPLSGVKARVIVSNPPYISPDERSSLPASVREWEPSMALFADEGGMARYDVRLAGAPGHLENGGWLVLEVDSRRAGETARRAREDGRYSEVRLLKDLSGRQRVLVARYNPA